MVHFGRSAAPLVTKLRVESIWPKEGLASHQCAARLFRKGRLVQEFDGRRTRISRDELQSKVRDEIVSRRIRMVFGYATEARGQLILHVKARIGRQDCFLVAITQLLKTKAAEIA